MKEQATELLILWTDSDKETAINMVSMYAWNSIQKGWWKEVTVMIWGGSSKLAADDPDIKEHLKKLRDSGIRVIACKQCALNYAVVEKLEAQGIEVFFTGEYLSEWIKSDKKLISI
jgi:hypothetical protein